MMDFSTNCEGPKKKKEPFLSKTPFGKAPNILPKSLENYFDDRMAEKAEKYKEAVNLNDTSNYTSATELEKARREISCLDGELMKARREWMESKKLQDIRWKDANDRYNLIFDSIPELNGYYKDSFAKRERSYQIVIREKADALAKDRELRRKQKEFAALQEIHNTQTQRLEKFEIFKAYLNQVKEGSQGEYSDIRDIIERYNTLTEAKGVLDNRNEEIVEYGVTKQKIVENDILVKSTELTILRNYLSELVDYKDAIQEEAQRLEDSLHRIKSTAAQRTKIIGQIKMSIDGLYKQVCKYMHRPAKLTPTDTLGQLADIGISVGEMFKLSKDIKHMLKTAFVTAEAERLAKAKEQKKEEERKRRHEKLTGRGKSNFRELYDLPPLDDTSTEVDVLLQKHSMVSKKESFN